MSTLWLNSTLSSFLNESFWESGDYLNNKNTESV